MIIALIYVKKDNAICELKHKKLKKSTHTFMSQEGDRHYNKNFKFTGYIQCASVQFAH